MRSLLAILACVGFLMSCDKTATPAAPSGSSPIVLQLNWKAEPQFGGFYAAQQGGKFAGQHLVVDVREGGAGTPTIDMVAAGTVPFAVVSGDELIVARARGKKVVALYAVYQTHPQGIMTHAARGFKEIGDVFKSDGILAMQAGLAYADFLKNKFGFDKVKIVPSPGGDLSTFRSDDKYSMQCFVTSEPLAAKKLGLDVKTFLIADAGYNPYATVLVTTEDYLNANRVTVESMVQAVAEGWEQYLTDPTAANSEMGKINKTMDAQTFTEAAEAQKPLIQNNDTATNGLGSMTKERWESLGKQLVELKLVDKAPSAEECFVKIR
jgi:NitT/TauT family transport system substrate-binding protein